VLFEPDPDNLALLSRTLRDAAIPRATVVPCAVSDKCGEARFLRDRDTGHTGGLASGPARSGIDVRTVTLDAMLEAGPPPDLVKIDVEGGEAAVFAGAGRLIGAIQPILLFESFAAARASVLARLGTAGYSVIGAEDPDGPMDEASNFLALPPRHAADLDAIRGAWRSELAITGLGSKDQVDCSPSSRS
jgi:FkbM family methyltransferase